MKKKQSYKFKILYLIIFAITIYTALIMYNNKKDPLIKNIKSIGHIYLVENKKRIKDSSVIVTQTVYGAVESTACINGICNISKENYPITLFKTTQKNIPTSCQWKEQYLANLPGATTVNYKNYDNLLINLKRTALKKIDFNPCNKKIEECINTPGEKDYVLDINTGKSRIIEYTNNNISVNVITNLCIVILTIASLTLVIFIFNKIFKNSSKPLISKILIINNYLLLIFSVILFTFFCFMFFYYNKHNTNNTKFKITKTLDNSCQKTDLLEEGKLIW